jgi:hypothetical protein
MLYAFNLFVPKIRDSKLYISFSIAALELALSQHYVLLSRRRDARENAALAYETRYLQHCT